MDYRWRKPIPSVPAKQNSMTMVNSLLMIKFMLANFYVTHYYQKNHINKVYNKLTRNDENP